MAQLADILEEQRKLLEASYVQIAEFLESEDKVNRLSLIGRTWHAIYNDSQVATDLDKAISIQREAVNLGYFHPQQAQHLESLSSALEARYDYGGNRTDIDEAIQASQNSLNITQRGAPENADILMRFASNHDSRFRRLGDVPDIDVAISSYSEAIASMPKEHPNKASGHNDLATALLRRFRHLGILEDLDGAIPNLKNAISLTADGHPDKVSFYSNLGGALQFRFERRGDLADLEMAITNVENAVRLTPDGHAFKPSLYINLGAALQSRFGRLGDLADLEMAITNQENAMKLTPDGHPSKPLRYISHGNTLLRRFERLGVLSDLEMAISKMENAMKLTPDGHPSKPLHYISHGNVLLRRFERLGIISDLETAISNMENAVRLTPDEYPGRPSYYNNLGGALRRRFEHLGALSDLELAIINFENAVRLTADEDPHKPSWYNNLGDALYFRYERLGNLANLEMAITNQENAVRLTPDGHPDKVFRTFNLANCYESRFISLAKRPDLELAHSLYATAAQSPAGRPQQRFNAALKWSYCAKRMHISPLPAFKCAIDQLPRIAWLGIPFSEQHSLLEKIGGTIREGVAAAIEAEEYTMALEWVEQGRSIVWQNLLKLRSPLDDLRAVHPELAARLQSISQRLNVPAGREVISQTPLDTTQKEVTKTHTRLAIEWDEIVEEIRKLSNFETFLKPKSFDCLVPAARDGPVIILNVSEDRCDALALIPDDNGGASVVSIPLENFTLEKSQKLLQEMKNLLKMTGVRDGDMRAAKRVHPKLDPKARFKSTLCMLWREVVKPVLDGLAFQPRESDLLRIWWCATGPLAFLPIHAAGDYDMTEVGHKLFDYAVSSYTPTLTAILESSYLAPSNDFKLLTVAQPSAPGLSEIPKTIDEVETIVKIATGFSIFSLTKEDATVEKVQKAMRESSWVHLACHGKQDASKPLESCLILHDGTLKLSTIIKENLPNAEFAFLSACQTAMGDEKVEEESVHLAAGMLLAGFKGVNATMWSIKDDVAPRVAEVVYSRILKDGKPNRKEAAYALHDAVKQLRESGADFTSWVPFIHIGR